MILEEDHVSGGQSSFFADVHDPRRRACSRWNRVILVGNKEPAFGDHLGTILGRARTSISNYFWTDLGATFDRQELAYSVKEGQKRYIHTISIFFIAFSVLGGLKLDEIDAANSFLTLLMARNGLRWPFKSHLRPV